MQLSSSLGCWGPARLFSRDVSISPLRRARSSFFSPFVQDNIFPALPGACCAGLHLQNPFPQGKLVTVLHGKVLDVAVRVVRRVGSPNFGRHVAVELSDENRRQLLGSPRLRARLCRSLRDRRFLLSNATISTVRRTKSRSAGTILQSASTGAWKRRPCQPRTRTRRCSRRSRTFLSMGKSDADVLTGTSGQVGGALRPLLEKAVRSLRRRAARSTFRSPRCLPGRSTDSSPISFQSRGLYRGGSRRGRA